MISQKKELLKLSVIILNESELILYSQQLEEEYQTVKRTSTLDIIRAKKVTGLMKLRL